MLWGVVSAIGLIVFGAIRLCTTVTEAPRAFSEIARDPVIANQQERRLLQPQQQGQQSQTKQPTKIANDFKITDELFGELIRKQQTGQQALVAKAVVERNKSAESGAGKAKSKYYRTCVLLTATVQVNIDLRKTGFGKNQQRNATERKEMYIGVLSHYLKTFPSVPVVLVENSGDDLCWAETTAASLNRSAINGNASCQSLHSSFPESGLPKTDQNLDPMKRLSIVRVQQPKVCKIPGEIGCSEAHSVTMAVQQSPHFDPRTKGYCTHALKVTGRFAIKSDLPKILEGCGTNWSMAVQNPKWRKINLKGKSRQETQVLGFDIQYTEDMFGWWKNSGRCQECHQTPRVQKMRAGIVDGTLPADSLCDLPSMDVIPVGEGSTGLKRTNI